MKKHYITSATLCFILSNALISCNNNKISPVPEQPAVIESTEEKVVETPAFVPEINEDSVFYYVEKQVNFGPRVPGTQAHKACGDFLVNELKSFGPNTAKVTEQHSTATTFDNHTIPVRNIIAEFNPEKKKRVLLAAHWDTRPFAEMDKKNPNKPIDGANDGASGVAVLLEIARKVALYEPEIGIDIIFFDAEDWGDSTGRTEDSYCLGSQYWSKNPHIPNYMANYGILLDMVGAKNATFGIEEYSYRMASNIVYKVWSTAYKLGFHDYFISKRRGAVLDDHYYVLQNRQFPMIDIINFDPNSNVSFGETWHTHDDNIDNISKETLRVVTKTVINVIYSER